MHSKFTLTDVDLAIQLLPEREALGVIDVANVVGVNLAIAINAGNFGAPALANSVAGLTTNVTQS